MSHLHELGCYSKGKLVIIGGTRQLTGYRGRNQYYDEDENVTDNMVILVGIISDARSLLGYDGNEEALKLINRIDLLSQLVIRFVYAEYDSPDVVKNTPEYYEYPHYILSRIIYELANQYKNLPFGQVILSLKNTGFREDMRIIRDQIKIISSKKERNPSNKIARAVRKAIKWVKMTETIRDVFDKEKNLMQLDLEKSDKIKAYRELFDFIKTFDLSKKSSKYLSQLYQVKSTNENYAFEILDILYERFMFPKKKGQLLEDKSKQFNQIRKTIGMHQQLCTKLIDAFTKNNNTTGVKVIRVFENVISKRLEYLEEEVTKTKERLKMLRTRTISSNNIK